MKILIISLFFPPENSIASLRPYSWAKYWARAGHDVTVLTAPKEFSLSNSLMPIEGFKLLEIPIPGIKMMRFLAGKKPKKNNLNFFMAGKVNSKSWFGVKWLLGYISNFQQWCRIAFSTRMPDPRFLWSKVAYHAVADEVWDLVISTANPYFVHIPAYRLYRSGLTKKWIVDWRDLWTHNQFHPGFPLFRSIERWLERRWCRTANHITTVSEPLAEVLRNKYGDKVTVIYNGFDPEDYANLPNESAFPNDGVFRIIYTGSIYKGLHDPSVLFSVVKQMEIMNQVTPARLQILFCGINANVNHWASAHGVSAYVQYLGLIPRADVLHMQRDANALLFLEYESKAVKGLLSGKIFEYLYAGPPILAIGVGADSSVGMLLKETGRGMAYGHDRECLMVALIDILNNADHQLCNFNNNFSRIAQYARESQANRLLNI